MQIRKDEVDSFKKGKWIPSCQLVAKNEGEHLTDIDHSVTLIGAKKPHDYFNIGITCTLGKSHIACVVNIGNYEECDGHTPLCMLVWMDLTGKVRF